MILGISLQAGKSQVPFPIMSLGFFIDIIIPAELRHWGQLSLHQKRLPGVFPER